MGFFLHCWVEFIDLRKRGLGGYPLRDDSASKAQSGWHVRKTEQSRRRILLCYLPDDDRQESLRQRQRGFVNEHSLWICVLLFLLCA